MENVIIFVLLSLYNASKFTTMPKITPLVILKRYAAENPHFWYLPTASIERLFTIFKKHHGLNSTETAKAYADWLSLRPSVDCSALDLCRLWFVCEMGYCTEDEQTQVEANFFN